MPAIKYGISSTRHCGYCFIYLFFLLLILSFEGNIYLYFSLLTLLFEGIYLFFMLLTLLFEGSIYLFFLLLTLLFEGSVYFFLKPADINDGWIRFTQAIQQWLLDAVSSLCSLSLLLVSHGNESYNTNRTTNSLVTIIKLFTWVCVLVC